MHPPTNATKTGIKVLSVLTLLVLPFNTFSCFSEPPQAVNKVSLQAKTNSPLQFIGIGKPDIQIVDGFPRTEGLSKILQGAKWLFYPDGKFVFVPSKNANVRNDLYPITGTYKKVGDIFEFRAERKSSVVDASASVDGVIRVDKDRVLLEVTRVSRAGAQRQIARISQTLSPASQVTAQSPQRIQGIQVPSLFKVSLRGKTEAQAFSPIAATLKILPSSTGDSNPFFVILKTENDDVNGSLLWSSFAPIQAGQQEFDSKITINGKQVRLDVNPSQEKFRLDISWMTIPSGMTVGSIPVGVAVKQGTMNFSIESDSISGTVQAEGISDLGNSSLYEAEFTGKMIAEDITFSVPKKLQKKQVVKAEKQTSESITPFNGSWQLEQSEASEPLKTFGELELKQEGVKVHGKYTGRGGGKIKGTVRGNRLDFTWKDKTGRGWGFLRAIADGTTLTGMWGIGKDKTGGQNLLATQPKKLSSAATSSQDMRVLRDEGYDLFLQGKCQQAISLLEKASTLFKQESENPNVSNLMRTSALIDVVNIHSRLSSCYLHTKDYLGLQNSLHEVIETRRSLNQIDYIESVNREQANYIQNSIANYAEWWRQRIISDEKKIEALQNAQGFLENLMRLFVDSGNEQEALLVVEKSKARAFADILNKRLSPNIWEAYATPPTIQQIQKIARTQNATLVEYATLCNDITKLNSLNSNDKKKSYYDSCKKSDLLIWVVKPTGEVELRTNSLTKLQPLEKCFDYNSKESKEPNIEAFVNGTKRAINDQHPNRQASDPNPCLKQWHKFLIEPISELLPSNPKSSIIFIPHKELFFVPFPALLDTNGKYLIQKHTIVTAPSIQVLDSTHKLRLQNQGKTKDVLVVGNPKLTNEVVQKYRLQSVEFLEQGANEIANKFNTTALTGEQATKAEILNRLPQTRIIHLATHGKYQEKEGLKSWIALARSGNDNGLLTAEEIFKKYAPPKGTPLRAELIFLAACQTGQGDIKADGVIGLSRSLIAAGIPSIVASLATARSNSTNFLTKEFYNHLSLGKAQALREAMLKTMKVYPEPVHWAWFTVIGEGK